MARATFNLVKDTWTQVATGACVVTVIAGSKGIISFNESGSDVNALKDDAFRGDQFLQNEAVATWVKASEDGWSVLVDGVL